MSALTGFHLTWLNGVRGSDVADKALPLVSFTDRMCQDYFEDTNNV